MPNVEFRQTDVFSNKGASLTRYQVLLIAVCVSVLLVVLVNFGKSQPADTRRYMTLTVLPPQEGRSGALLVTFPDRQTARLDEGLADWPALDQRLVRELNQLSRQGWKVVQVTRSPSAQGSSHYLLEKE